MDRVERVDDLKGDFHDHDFDDGFDGSCWNCDGEGYVWSCFDGLCLNAEDGCDLCTRQCDVCDRRKPKDSTNG